MQILTVAYGRKSRQPRAGQRPGDPVLQRVLGRQVPTEYGGFVDVLGVDAEGRIHVIEVKRDRTPREVVAQIASSSTSRAGTTR